MKRAVLLLVALLGCGSASNPALSPSDGATVTTDGAGAARWGLKDPAGRFPGVLRVDGQGNLILGGAAVELAGQKRNLFGAIAKHQASGERLWAKWIDDGAGAATGVVFLEAAAVDGGDNIYVAGAFRAYALAGVTASDASALYVAKFDPAGSRLWIKAFPLVKPSPNALLYVQDMRIDAAGDVVVCGDSTDSLDGKVRFGGVFALKLGPDGQEKWLSQYGSLLTAQGMALGPAGSVFLTGALPDAGMNGQYIAQVDPAGSLLAFESLGKTFGIVLDMESSADGSQLYLVGAAAGAGTATGSDGAGLVARYGANGQLLWSIPIDTPSRNDALNAVIVAGDSVYVTGNVGAARPGGTFGLALSDTYVARLDALTGAIRWERQYPSRASKNVAYGVDLQLTAHDGLLVLSIGEQQFTPVGFSGWSLFRVDRNSGELE